MTANVVQGPGFDRDVPGGGAGGSNGGIEARIAKLEAITGATDKRLDRIETDIRDLRQACERDFRLTWGMVIAVALGLAGLLAKGFKWL
jgi:hypothetical protein